MAEIGCAVFKVVYGNSGDMAGSTLAKDQVAGSLECGYDPITVGDKNLLFVPHPHPHVLRVFEAAWHSAPVSDLLLLRW